MQVSGRRKLTSETVKGTALPLEGVDDVHSGHRLPLGVLGVGDGIPDYVFEEYLENASGLLVDETGDTFHTASPCQSPDGGLRDALDVVTEDLPVPLGTAFPESFAALTASSHVEQRMIPLGLLTGGYLCYLLMSPIR